MDKNNPKRLPDQIDWETAEKNTPNWNDLTKRKKGQLAKDEMYHREYHDLATAIMNSKPRTS